MSKKISIKTVFSLIGGFLLVFLLFSSTSCGEHQHSFGEYQYDENVHYHICSGCNEKFDVEEHSITYTNCSKCGYTVSDDSLNTDNQGFVYTLNEGTYTLVGVEPTNDYAIEIPEMYKNIPVTTIASDAFVNAPNIKKLTLPKTVSKIEDGAFSSLHGVVEIYNISNVNITSSRDDLSYAELIYHTSLSEESSIEVVDEFVFATNRTTPRLIGYCGDEKNLTFPTTFHGKAYSISSYAFAANNEIKSANISSQVESIESEAFFSCTKLTQLILGPEVKSVSYYAFLAANVREFYNLTSINSSNIFSEYSSLVVPEVVHTSLSEASCLISEDDFDYVYVNDKYFLFDYSGDETDITLPTSIRGSSYQLSKAAFLENQTVKHLTIPSSVTSIPSFSFMGWTELFSIRFTNVNMEISDNTFLNSDKIMEVYRPLGLNLPSRITESAKIIHSNVEDESWLINVDDFLFFQESEGQYFLYGYVGKKKNIDLPADILGNSYSISEDAFFASNIESVSIPSGVKEIGERAFAFSDSLKTVYIAPGVTKISVNAFDSCRALKEITIPDTATLSAVSFAGCHSLESITIPSGMTVIPASCFINCVSLKEVKLPQGLTMIESSAFMGCSSLETIVLPTTLKTINASAFEGCTSLNGIALPIELTRIEESVFKGCSSLTKIQIPNQVSKIETNLFADCVSLEEVTMSDSVQIIASGAFSRCTSLKTVEFSDSITAIDSSAFLYCTSLRSIVLPKNLQIIREDAFSDCRELSSIVLYENLHTIESNAFHNCHKLSEIYNGSNLVLYIGSAEHGCIASDVMEIYDTTTEPSIKIEDQNGYQFMFFDDAYWLVDYVGTEKNLVLPEQINGCSYKIGNYAFAYKDIVSVVLPEGIKIIHKGTFEYCTSLTQVTIPQSVEIIEDRAFYHTNLHSLVIPNQVYSIESSSFYCPNLCSLVIGSSLTSIPDYLVTDSKLAEVYNLSQIDLVAAFGEFYVSRIKAIHTSLDEESIFTNTSDGYSFILEDGAYSLYGYFGTEEELTLPTSINGQSYTIYASAFQNTTSIKKVHISNGVTAIGGGAFFQSSIEEISISSTVKQIGYVAFGDSSLISITFETKDGWHYANEYDDYELKIENPEDLAKFILSVTNTSYFYQE